MLDVFFTVDVEIWCDGWTDLDAKFPEAFRKYVYGRTARGDFGMTYQADMLRDHGMTGVFFVEPLFSGRFGGAPLAEIVGLLNERDQETQLHLHTEWVDEWKEPLLPGYPSKRQYLRQFTHQEQVTLIAAGQRLLERAGGAAPCAFRAGGCGFDIRTLSALRQVGIRFDSSYNATASGADSGLLPGQIVVEPVDYEGVTEYPVTVFADGSGGLRPAQLGACSFAEIEGLLWQALDSGRLAFVLLSHNFELLNRRSHSVDRYVLERFRKLISFLDQHRDCFAVRGFRDLQQRVANVQPAPLRSPLWKTGARYVEQLLRRTQR
jgi:peptidoglycan/xylan/chitin deacetylase (PgdA/CDA1 family)